jgi:trans-aconitate methyltransferase
VDSQYGAHYRDLYQRHWWWRAREEAVLEVIGRHVPKDRARRILDVGCGDGLMFDKLASFGNVEGVEVESELVDPDGAHRGQIHVTPFDRNFQPEKQFSLILMLDVLEHLDNPGEALNHAHSLLAPDGALLVTVPAFRSLWTNHDVINHHRTRYRRKTLRPLLSEAKFDILEERYWYQWTCPVKFLVRVSESALRRRLAVPQIPPAWINGPLYVASRIEQETLGAIGTPFGSTLMAYCEKRKTDDFT